MSMNYNFKNAFNHLITDSEDESDESEEKPRINELPSGSQSGDTKPELEIKPNIAPVNTKSNTEQPLVIELDDSPEVTVLSSGSTTPFATPDLSPHPGEECVTLYSSPSPSPSPARRHDEKEEQEEEEDSDIITLKLQDGNRKHLKEFQISKYQSLKRLKELYAKAFDIDLTRMKLRFDGDPVEDEDTPESLDIEDGCVIDVMISN